MSDILIKGMKMPANCFLCPLSYLRENRLFCYQTKDEVVRAKIADNCPIVQVPPHGRLIDANALLESIKEARKKDPEIEDVYTDDYFTVAGWVASAPTIIGAEEDE